MTSNPASEIASLLQSSSVNKNPDPSKDLSPSTAASKKTPVQPSVAQAHHRPRRTRSRSSKRLPTSSASGECSGEDIPISILQPLPRTQTHFPLPDLRFEQSYLSRINTCSSTWSIAWVTFLDQVLFPLVQGIGWNVILSGWRHYNRGVKFQGHGVGARMRRWWWDVNKWKLPSRGQ